MTNGDNQSLSAERGPGSPFLHNEVDVPQGHILQLWLGGQQRDQWWSQLLQQGTIIVQVLGQHLHELHEHLHGRQHHGRVGVGEAWGDALTDTIGGGRVPSGRQS